MKIRNGFVSNSSSSSFIIGINNSDECPTCHRKSLNIVDAIEQMRNSESETYVEARGKEDILTHLKKDWGYEEKELKSVKEAFDKFEKSDVALVRISYHDIFLNSIIDNAKENGITIIKDFN